MARLAALLVSAYMLGAPFLIGALLKRSSHYLTERGIDLDALTALVAFAGVMAPIACGLALVISGDRVFFIYFGYLLSIATLVYWSWRARPLLFPARPPVVK